MFLLDEAQWIYFGIIMFIGCVVYINEVLTEINSDDSAKTIQGGET